MSAPAITFLIRSLDVGGAERQLVELATGLHRSAWRVKVITFYPNGPLEERLKTAGVPIVCLNKRGRWDIACLRRLAQDLRRDAPDIVHGYLPLPNILLVLLRPTLRTHVVWGVRASNMDLDRYDWLAKIEFALARILSRFADLIICNSEAGRAYHLARGFRSDRAIVIPNGIDLTRFKPDESARKQLRAEWGIDGNRPLVGIVARLDVMKDHSNFLRAAALVLQARPDTRFVCVGGGIPEYRDKLRRLNSSLGLDGCVMWADLRTDVWRVYNALDVAVLSSAFGEGFPNVVAEAMATGVPCVVTDVGDAAAVVGDRGWVCPPGDSASLARAMIDALNALPCDAAALRNRVHSHYSTEALLERTAARLFELLGNARSSTRAVAAR